MLILQNATNVTVFHLLHLTFCHFEWIICHLSNEIGRFFFYYYLFINDLFIDRICPI